MCAARGWVCLFCSLTYAGWWWLVVLGVDVVWLLGLLTSGGGLFLLFLSGGCGCSFGVWVILLV